MMNSLTRAVCVCLWCCYAGLVRPAPALPGPLPDSPGWGSSVERAPLPDSPGWGSSVERARTLVDKILRDLPGVHLATVTSQGLTLGPSSQPDQLQYLMTSLGIPKPPVLVPLSDHFTLEVSVRRMLRGVGQARGQLEALEGRLASHRLTEIRSDLRDLHTQITMMQELGHLTPAAASEGGGVASEGGGVAWRLHGDYEVQVALHLTLLHLRAFSHDMARSLRSLTPPRRA